MIWSRKPATPHERTRHAGLDLTATRAVGASTGSGKVRTLLLDGPREELLLYLAMDRRPPEVGRTGYSLARRVPHLVCSCYLPLLTQPREWRAGRQVVTPESALEVTFQKLREAIQTECESAALSLPPYLTPLQISRVASAAGRARFPLRGTTVGPLAVVAHRAGAFAAGGSPLAEEPVRDDVIPLRPAPEGPGAVVVVDVDDFALSATMIAVERDLVRLAASAHWPRFGLKAWKDRLLDAASDRCVRLCRRDPRDSADAEQSLFEQLDESLDRARAGQRINLTIRTDRWFQDVVQQPEDLEAQCVSLATGAAEGIRDAIAEVGLSLPPREVWLTHEAARMPGLSRAVQSHVREGTLIDALPKDAAAVAAAGLVPRWLSAELPRAHLDAVIPLPPADSDRPADPAKTGWR